jgi:hypothetical protein
MLTDVSEVRSAVIIGAWIIALMMGAWMNGAVSQTLSSSQSPP